MSTIPNYIQYLFSLSQSEVTFSHNNVVLTTLGKIMNFMAEIDLMNWLKHE